MVQHQCLDLDNNPVEEEFCDQKEKPSELFASCNEERCPARYVNLISKSQLVFNGQLWVIGLFVSLLNVIMV